MPAPNNAKQRPRSGSLDSVESVQGEPLLKLISISCLVALGSLLASYSSTLGDLLHLEWGQRSGHSFQSLESFYPFYLTQHHDPWSRRLHFVGTTIVIVLMCVDSNIMISLLLGALFGLTAFQLTRSLSNGLLEAVITLGVFLQCYRTLSNSYKKAFLVLLVGYGFAWVGHFFFEKNRPATFAYPVYSLASDFKLWFHIISGKEKIW